MIFCCYSTLTTIVFPRLAPVAVCSLVAARIAGVDDVLGAIGKLGLYILTTLCGLLGHALVLLPLIFFVITRKNPYAFIKGVGDALMTAFGIASRFVGAALLQNINSMSVGIPKNEIKNKKILNLIILEKYWEMHQNYS